MSTLATHSERIAGFVATFFEPGRPGARPERIVIRHVSANDRQADVGSLPLPDEASTEASVIEIAGRLGDLIATDADGLGGMQRYVLIAMRGAEVIGRLPLRTAGGADDSAGEPIDSEPATARGLVAQLMRHNEANSRIVSLSMGQIVATLLRQNERLRLVAEEAEDKRYAVANLTEQLLSQQHERDLEAKTAEERAELIRHGFSQLRAVVPYVAACFRTSKSDFLRNLSQAFPAAGGPSEPSDDGEDAPAAAAGTDSSEPIASQSAIGSLFASLSDDQKTRIFELLNPEQQMTLIGLATSGGAGATAAPEQRGDAQSTPSTQPAVPRPPVATDSAGAVIPPRRQRRKPAPQRVTTNVGEKGGT